MNEETIAWQTEAAERVFGDFTLRQRSHAGDELEIVAGLDDQRVVIRSVTVTNPNPSGVTQTGLRQVAAGAHRYAEQYIAAHVASVFETPDSQQPTAERFEDGRKRKYWTEDRLVEVAKVYLAAEREGRRPRKAVVEHFGMSASRAAVLIRQAKDAGIFARLGRTFD